MIKCIVPISGGKDSQACLVLALRQFHPDEILGLFCDTLFEHPLTYAHIETMRRIYPVEIHRLNNGSVEDQVLKHKRFPHAKARFCTEELKIWPSKRFYEYLALEQKEGFEVWMGVRQQESQDRAKRYAGKVCDEVYPPHEFMAKYPKKLAKLGISFRLPIVDWSTLEVLTILEGQQNPLYAQGFDRVGCFPCLASGDAWKRKAFEHDASGAWHYQVVRFLEKEIGKPVWTSKKELNKDSGSGCALCAI